MLPMKEKGAEEREVDKESGKEKTMEFKKRKKEEKKKGTKWISLFVSSIQSARILEGVVHHFLPGEEQTH